MTARASLKFALILTGCFATAMIGVIPPLAPAVLAASLLADQFSFKARTLRVYVERNGQPLHIAHTISVVVRRPDRLAIDVTGDDGSSKLFYDGKTATIFGGETKHYSTIPVPDTIQGMLETVTGKLGVDFPLSDFLTNAPDKSFLTGVTSGREVNTVTIDGVPCRHLLFTQPPGLELELWIEKNDKALPRRLIVTYRSEPGQPSYVAEFFDWNFSVHPTDADFTFQPPEGATQVELKPAGSAPAARQKGAKP
jgi:hypothetical protein